MTLSQPQIVVMLPGQAPAGWHGQGQEQWQGQGHGHGQVQYARMENVASDRRGTGW